MPIVSTNNLFDSSYILIFAKGFVLLIFIFYAIFSLMVVRQVGSMSKTLITSLSPIVKAISIFNAGFAIGMIILSWGIL